VSPSNLVKNLRCISKSFRMWRQEDAHEYLRCLIEGLHNCCLPPGVKSNSAVSQERSLIHKIFGGRLRSQVVLHLNPLQLEGLETRTFNNK
jgi:ubiquitin carboxyl-terminal hydrolase 36/42